MYRSKVTVNSVDIATARGALTFFCFGNHHRCISFWADSSATNVFFDYFSRKSAVEEETQLYFQSSEIVTTFGKKYPGNLR